ncbi:MAG: MBL fold metallo-hydrolase [Pseudomonadota bacterium]
MRSLLAALALLLMPAGALASTCYAFVEGVPGVRYASLEADFRLATQAPSVDIRFVAHSTYRIETPAGIVINTDYFGANGPGKLPDVVTMNHAHETHWTAYPDPAISHVLRGWNPDGPEPAKHELRLEDVTIRNVPTDIRGWGTPEPGGNSIFVFEVADLCIGHVGHLHHKPTEEQYALLGRIDVLMVPVDGGFTMSVEEMVDVAKTLKSRIVLPMHYFGGSSLERFIQGMSGEFEVEIRDTDVLTVSVETLPSRPKIIVLPPAGGQPLYLFDD